MDIIEAIKTRKSIRDFKPDPVSKKILWEILFSLVDCMRGQGTSGERHPHPTSGSRGNHL